MFKRVEKWRKEDGTQCQGDLKAKGERERDCWNEQKLKRVILVTNNKLLPKS